MWEMAKTSITLFMQGKLFQDTSMVMRQLGMGVAATAVLLVVLALLGIPVWISALLAGLLGGMLQPYLFKDLKYR